MPSTTFFNLPVEKREKLLRCARAEFARTSYSEASINKIIQAADIPRGSFYMYFIDKEDLFHYLMNCYGLRLEATLEKLLLAHSGDLFAAFLALYDHILARCAAAEGEESFTGLVQILRNNSQMQPHLFLQRGTTPPFIVWLSALVDRTLLDLRDERDLEDMLGVLIGVLGPAILNGTLAADPAPVRARLVNILDILRRGMARHPAPNED